MNRNYKELEKLNIKDIIKMLQQQDIEVEVQTAETEDWKKLFEEEKERYQKLSNKFDDEVEIQLQEKLAENNGSNLADSGFVSNSGHDDTQEKLTAAQDQITVLTVELDNALRKLDAALAERDARPTTAQLAEMQAQRDARTNIAPTNSNALTNERTAHDITRNKLTAANNAKIQAERNLLTWTTNFGAKNADDIAAELKDLQNKLEAKDAWIDPTDVIQVEDAKLWMDDEYKELQGKLNKAINKSNALNKIIDNAKNHLQVDDLAVLPNMGGKSLDEVSEAANKAVTEIELAKQKNTELEEQLAKKEQKKITELDNNELDLVLEATGLDKNWILQRYYESGLNLKEQIELEFGEMGKKFDQNFANLKAENDQAQAELNQIQEELLQKEKVIQDLTKQTKKPSKKEKAIKHIPSTNTKEKKKTQQQLEELEANLAQINSVDEKNISWNTQEHNYQKQITDLQKTITELEKKLGQSKKSWTTYFSQITKETKEQLTNHWEQHKTTYYKTAAIGTAALVGAAACYEKTPSLATNPININELISTNMMLTNDINDLISNKTYWENQANDWKNAWETTKIEHQQIEQEKAQKNDQNLFQTIQNKLGSTTKNWWENDYKDSSTQRLTEAVNKEKEKYQNFIDPTNEIAFKQAALAKGYKESSYRTNWIDPTNLQNEAKKEGMKTAAEFKAVQDDLATKNNFIDPTDATAVAKANLKPSTYVNPTDYLAKTTVENDYLLKSEITTNYLLKTDNESITHHGILAGLKPTNYRHDWINPVDLATKAQQKGMVSAEEFNQRPNISKKVFEKDYKNRPTKQEHEGLKTDFKQKQQKLADLTIQFQKLQSQLNTQNGFNYQDEANKTQESNGWDKEFAKLMVGGASCWFSYWTSSEKNKKKVKQLMLDLEKLEKEKQLLSDEVSKKDTELTKKVNEISAKDIELNKKTTQIQKLTNDYNQLQINKDQQIINTKNLLKTEQDKHKLTTQALQTEQTARTTEKTNSNKKIADLKLVLTKKETEYQTLSQTNANLQTEVTSLTKLANQPTSCQEKCCLGDYDKVKNELDAKEKKLNCTCSETINSNLRLGLEFEFGSDDERDTKINKIVQRIKELLTKPDNDNENLEKELKTFKKINIDMLKDALGEPAAEKVEKNIENACNYKQVTAAQREAIKYYSNQKLDEIKNLSEQKEKISKQLVNERIILSTSLLVILLTIGSLIYKFKAQKKLRNVNKKSKLLANY